MPPHDIANWKEFYINDIFTISPGKRLTKANMDSGAIPFIGATDSNNGITSWIATPNASFDRNVLGVNYNGSVVENFYHAYGCVFSDDVKRLHIVTTQLSARMNVTNIKRNLIKGQVDMVGPYIWILK